MKRRFFVEASIPRVNTVSHPSFHSSKGPNSGGRPGEEKEKNRQTLLKNTCKCPGLARWLLLIFMDATRLSDGKMSMRPGSRLMRMETNLRINTSAG